MNNILKKKRPSHQASFICPSFHFHLWRVLPILFVVPEIFCITCLRREEKLQERKFKRNQEAKEINRSTLSVDPRAFNLLPSFPHHALAPALWHRDAQALRDGVKEGRRWKVSPCEGGLSEVGSGSWDPLWGWGVSLVPVCSVLFPLIFQSRWHHSKLDGGRSGMQS